MLLYVVAVDPRQTESARATTAARETAYLKAGVISDCGRNPTRHPAAIAEMIHDADLADEKFGRIDALGIDRVLNGWANQGVSDDELLRRGMDIVEGLYRSLA